MSSAVMAHLLQLDRPDATPRLPATAEAVTLTPTLSHGPQQDGELERQPSLLLRRGKLSRRPDRAFKTCSMLPAHGRRPPFIAFKRRRDRHGDGIHERTSC